VVNYEKSKLLPFNVDLNKFDNYGLHVIGKGDSECFLGCNIGLCETDNWKDIIEDTHAAYNQWKKYNLSLIGRFMVAKTMILSKLWYQSYFDLPNAQQIKTITNDYWNFINGKATTSRISYKNCYCTPELGGFNALNIEMKLRTNLCSWKKKINEGHPWCYLLKKHMDLNVTLLPSRTRDILASWNRLQTVENEDHISIIGINKNLIELNKATSKDIYLNIMLDQIPKTITPKDNQDINDLKHYFKWIKKNLV